MNLKKWILRQIEKIIEAINVRKNNSVFWNYFGSLIQTLSGQLHLLISEKSLAFPNKNEWLIYKLPLFNKSRKVPKITSMPGNTRTLHGSDKHIKIMGEFYTYENFLEIEEDDIVIDVGAFVGGFTLYAAKKARHVIAIEPSATMFDSLHFNTQDLKNVTVVEKAAWKESKIIKLNCSQFPNENSIFYPDTGASGKSVEVQADTVPKITRDAGFEEISYFKLEAEGAEPEILQSTLEGSVPVKKVVIDVTPERGEVTIDNKIIKILESYNYQWKRKSNSPYWGDDFIFGKKYNSLV